jgi:hypothetical protein
MPPATLRRLRGAFNEPTPPQEAVIGLAHYEGLDAKRDGTAGRQRGFVKAENTDGQDLAPGQALHSPTWS